MLKSFTMTKTKRLLVILLCVFAHTLHAQSYQWGLTTAKAERSQAVSVRQNSLGEIYLATYSDSVTIRLYSQFEKRDANQQLIWQKQINGNVTIADFELNAAGNPVVAGYFQGTISIDGILLTGITGVNTGFIFECDTTGSVQWVHTLNPGNSTFEPVDLFIAQSGLMYLTSELYLGNAFCAFHKLNAVGNIIQTELPTTFENRTFSHIRSDASGNVYLSGTCGNLATFDNLTPNPTQSYQNFLVKYDSSFNAQWLITRNYITFDHNNEIGSDGQNLYWAFVDFTNNSDTVKIIKTDLSGQILNTIDGPMAIAFFPGVDYSVDSSGNSTLIVEAFTRFYIYRYDSAFNIVWQDTLMTQISGFPLHTDLICYDSCFYIASIYTNDTLEFDNQFMLINPNSGSGYPSDVFVCKWGYNQALSANDFKNANEILVFPNPVTDIINVDYEESSYVFVSDIAGKIVYSSSFQKQIDVSKFSEGIYFLRLISKDKSSIVRKFCVAR